MISKFFDWWAGVSDKQIKRLISNMNGVQSIEICYSIFRLKGRIRVKRSNDFNGETKMSYGAMRVYSEENPL